MRLVLKAVDVLTSVLGWLAIASIVLMMVQVTADVLGKYLFDMPMPASLTLVAEYYMPLVVFLPLAFVERADKHVRVEVLTSILPRQLQFRIIGWTYFLSMIICGLLAYATGIEAHSKYHINAFQIEQGIKVLIWPARFSAPVGYAFLTLVLALKYVTFLYGRETVPYEHGEMLSDRSVDR